MKWSVQDENKLRELYLNTSFNLNEITKRLGRTPGALSGRLVRMGIKKKLHPDAKFPKKMTPALARIHAHVCGDGYRCTYLEKDNYGYWARYRKNPVRVRCVVGYCNNNMKLLKEFQDDMYEVFGVRGKKIYKNDIKVNSKRIWETLKKFGPSSSYEWAIPKEINSGSQEVRRNWIRAFFDDEADFNDDGRIRVKCVNKQGMIQLMNMLKKFVPCYITPKKGYYWGNTVCLNIRKKDTPEFFAKIGSLRYSREKR